MLCEVHGEVGNCDVVGIGKGYEIIVELKTSMSLQLLDQATDRVGRADYIFIAVPKRRRFISRSAKSYLMSIKVGIIEVDLKEGYAKVVQWGKRHKTRHSLKKLTNKNTKRSIGGVSSSEMNTPY